MTGKYFDKMQAQDVGEGEPRRGEPGAPLGAEPRADGAGGVKVILFGATGMIGQGVLRECLLDPDVEQVLVVGRETTGVAGPQAPRAPAAGPRRRRRLPGKLAGYDACYFCLGVSSNGMTEEKYHRITHDLTLAIAEPLARLNPGMSFVYVSGRGTDSTEKGAMMWARVKGKTENALLRLPFRSAFMFRPAAVQPMHGETSKVKLYRFFLVLFAPIFPILRVLAPSLVTTTESIGRAMLVSTKKGAPKQHLESLDITSLAHSTP